MVTKIEPLYKSQNTMTFGWAPESGTITGYKVYASLVPQYGSMTFLTDVLPGPSARPQDLGKVSVDISIELIRSTLGLPASDDFLNLLLYYTITYLDANGVESTITDSTIVEVPPAGILSKKMRDDPTVNRHEYVFSDSEQRWTKMMGSADGAVITDPSGYYALNTVTEFTYDGGGNVLTEKIYLSDRTASGSPAKLKTYTYSGGNVSTITITDSTV